MRKIRENERMQHSRFVRVFVQHSLPVSVLQFRSPPPPPREAVAMATAAPWRMGLFVCLCASLLFAKRMMLMAYIRFYCGSQFLLTASAAGCVAVNYDRTQPERQQHITKRRGAPAPTNPTTDCTFVSSTNWAAMAATTVLSLSLSLHCVCNMCVFFASSTVRLLDNTVLHSFVFSISSPPMVLLFRRPNNVVDNF